VESSLVQWHEQLPPSLRFTPSAISLRGEFSELGGLLFLHITYHQSLVDLHRSGMDDIVRTGSPLECPSHQKDFVTHVENQCFDHACAIAAIYQEALRHGPEVLADTWLSVVAHDAAHVIIHHTVDGLGSLGHRMPRQTIYSPLRSLLCALERMEPSHALAKPLVGGSSLPTEHGTDIRSAPVGLGHAQERSSCPPR